MSITHLQHTGEDEHAAAIAQHRVPMDPADAKSFRALMGRFATGVTVVTYACDGQPAGMTVNGFLSVSMRPPLVLVSVRSQSRFTGHMGIGSRYGVNLLAERQQYLSAHFAGRPDESVHPAFWNQPTLPMLEGCLGYVMATVTDIHPAGDHLLYVGAVDQLVLGSDAAPLIFYGGRYKRLHAHTPAMSVFDGSDWW